MAGFVITRRFRLVILFVYHTLKWTYLLTTGCVIILTENSPTDLSPPGGNLRCDQIQVKCLSARKALPIDLLFHMEARSLTRTMLTLTAILV